MYKISIAGKANTGKNTLGKLLFKEIYRRKFDYVLPHESKHVQYIAFADPIKEIISSMFPNIPKEHLYGSSELRNQIIPNAFKDGKPLTIRNLLLDLGTNGRAYKENLWIDVFNARFENAKQSGKQIVIVTDVRFKNEFDFLKALGFYQIRLLRDSNVAINHISETNQNLVKDSEFDYIVNNNGTIDDLKEEVTKIVSNLKE